MRKRHIGIGVIILILISVTLLITPEVSCKDCKMEEQIIKIINVKEWIEGSKNREVIILDIRTPEEFEEFHIKDATNLDFYSENYKEELDKLDKDKTYFTYCRSGSRSGSNAKIMKELGFTSVLDLKGGINTYYKFTNN